MANTVDTGDPVGLPADALALLPDPDTTPRCAAFAREINIDPGGTAIRADAVIVIETPLPWPKPVFDHPTLTGLRSMVETAMGPARVLAAVPHDPADPRVLVFRRRGAGAESTVHRPPDALDFVARLADVDPTDLAHEPGPVAAVLICTQGSHDVCCGAEGMDLAVAAGERLDVPVFRVSHTGGHRFAPTAMTLPDGRMWAHLSIEQLTTLMADGSSNGTELGPQCRGWWGADTGPAQMAERAAWVDSDGAIAFDDRVVAVDEGSDGWDCTVAAGDDAWRVTVTAGRQIPTIACREPGGLPAKPGREYAVTTVVRSGESRVESENGEHE